MGRMGRLSRACCLGKKIGWDRNTGTEVHCGDLSGSEAHMETLSKVGMGKNSSRH